MNRDYVYDSNYRMAVAMHTPESDEPRKRLTIAVAFCNYRDQFNKKIARNILNGRLEKRLDTQDNIRGTFEVSYEGDTPRKDIFFPIVNALREALPQGQLALYREHRDIVSARHRLATAIDSVQSLVTL